MDINRIIGNNLNRLRTERNLSLGQLSELSGVSKVMLSQIEKGDTNPTINTIWKIANGLKVPYTFLLEEIEPNTTVVRESDLVLQSDDNGHYRIYCYYSNNPKRNFELFRLELDAGHSYTSIGHSDKSEEYILVLEGQLTLTVNNKKYVLNKNDAINFDSSCKHIYESSSNSTLKASITNFYPT